jgi:hypothetical protein
MIARPLQHLNRFMTDPLQQYRQGDVLLEAVDQIPSEARQETARARIIVAHGEATVHHHSLNASAADWWKTADDQQFIEVKRPANLEHQEHAPITLQPGRYRVVRQREYTPQQIRPVRD